MDWQQIAALTIVGVTALVMGWRRWGRRREGCGAGACPGCPARLPRRETRTGFAKAPSVRPAFRPRPPRA